MKRRYKSNIFRDIYDQPYLDVDLSRLKLYKSSKNSLGMVQRLNLLQRLPVHNGCVNSISWNEQGEYILSGSDDQHIVITNGFNYKVMAKFKTSHRANIFSAKFLPSRCDCHIVSCSGDGVILYTDLNRPESTGANQFLCHSGTAYDVVTVPSDPHSFLSCGEDGTVRWFDLRIKDKCRKTSCKEDILILCERAVTSLSVNPTAPTQLAVGCSDSRVRLFDRRMLGTVAAGYCESVRTGRPLSTFTVPALRERSCRITSLSHSPDGQELLASFSSDLLYLFTMNERGRGGPAAVGEGEGGGGGPPRERSPPPVRRLRLRGDWSDTGPHARPERDGPTPESGEMSQSRRALHATLMQRMTDVLSRMLSDPATRANLNGSRQARRPRDLPDAPAREPSPRDARVPCVCSRAPPGGDGRTPSPSGSGQTLDNGLEEMEVSSEGPREETSTGNVVVELVAPDCDVCAADKAGASPASPGASPTSPASPEASPASPEASPASPEASPAHPASPEASPASPEASPASPEASLAHAASPKASPASPEASPEASPASAEASPGASPKVSPASPRASPASPSRQTEAEEPDMQPPEGLSSRSGSDPPRGEEEWFTDTQDLMDTLDSPGHRQETDPAVPQSPSYVGHSRDTFGVHFPPDTERSDSDLPRNENDRQTREPAGGETAPRHRSGHPIEREMEAAMEGARASRSTREDEESSVFHPSVKQVFSGHRNARTMIKEACFWGTDYVMSGSDCGHVFVWERSSGRLVQLFEADEHVVNCLQPHPTLPVLATSGIDYDVKLWAPLAADSTFDVALADMLKKRNEIMLEETKDTITVPATFMIRMLACLNQIRRGGRRLRLPEDEETE